MADRRAGLTTAATAPPPAVRQVAGRWASRLTVLVAVLVGLLVVASVTGLLPVQVMRVDSGSMAPTVGTGDLLVVDRGGHPVGRRDVVVLPHPDTGVLLVKRVVAVAGEQVAIEDGVLVVDGAAVCEAPIDPSRLDGVWFGPVTVPDGHVFSLGDARGDSVDSRHFGPVPADDVVGLVRARVWPAPGALPAVGC